MRSEKKSIADEYRRMVEGADYLILADYRGLDVPGVNELRRRLGKQNAGVHVIKNRLFRIAADGSSFEGLRGFLEGPSALIVGRGDVVETAKLLKEFIKEHELPRIKAGVIGGRIIEGKQFERLANLPSRQQLLGQLVGTIAAPMTQLVGLLSRKAASIVYVLQAVKEQKEKKQ